MKAYEIVAGDDVDAIELRERSAPQPGYGQVVVDVRACSLNYRDIITISGAYGRQDAVGKIPLSDGAGVISAVGDGVTGFQAGDRVVGAFMPAWVGGPYRAEHLAGSLGGPVDGMLAEQVVLPASGILKIPGHLSFVEAATLPCAGVTAWYSSFVGANLGPGQTVLLLGTGGVSIFGLQFAKMVGAKAIITSSSDEKLETAWALGADHCINYRKNPDWEQEVLSISGGEGVDHAIEVGGGTLNKTLKAVRYGGSVALVGVLAGTADPGASGMLMLAKRVHLQGVYVGSVEMFDDMNRAISANQLTPVVDQVFPFEAAVEALRYQKSGRHFGKVAIEVGQS